MGGSILLPPPLKEKALPPLNYYHNPALRIIICVFRTRPLSPSPIRGRTVRSECSRIRRTNQSDHFSVNLFECSTGPHLRHPQCLGQKRFRRRRVRPSWPTFIATDQRFSVSAGTSAHDFTWILTRSPPRILIAACEASPK
jgi:hypothetical protein